MKNPNKKAGNWGALKNKPQNLVPFKKGGTTKQTDMKTNKKQMGGPTMKTRTVNKNGSYRTVEKMKGTPSSMKQSSKTTRTGYGIIKGAPKYKNIIQAPSPSAKPINPSAGGMMKKGGNIKKYQAGGTTAADKVAEQRAINAKRKADAQARTEKAKVDARAKIDQAQKNKPVVKPVEPVAQTTAPVKRNTNPEDEYLTITARKDNTKPQIGVRTQAYNYENKGVTKNKVNLLGRGVTKSKTDKYLVPGKDVRFSDTDSPEIIRRKLSYLNDRTGQQKTGTQKTRTVTNLKKGTIKNVTRSTGSYLKDGDKKRVVTKSMIPGKTNSGVMKRGGTIKKKK